MRYIDYNLKIKGTNYKIGDIWDLRYLWEEGCRLLDSEYEKDSSNPLKVLIYVNKNTYELPRILKASKVSYILEQYRKEFIENYNKKHNTTDWSNRIKIWIIR